MHLLPFKACVHPSTGNTYETRLVHYSTMHLYDEILRLISQQHHKLQI